MKKLILYGASNYGYEVIDLIEDINRSKANSEWEIAGFLDDNPDIQGKDLNGIKILGTKAWLKENQAKDYYFICCIGNPKVKKKIISFLKEYQVQFAILKHPTAVISSKASIGEGSIVMAGSIVSTLAKIKDHVIINLACTIGHNTVISDFCCINPGSNISGDVLFEEGVLAGTNSTVLEKLQIGKYATLGAASLTYTNVPEYASIIGVPGRIMKIAQ
ncbi:MAG TPA: acetyltransferase [Bacteroidia bacterium]|jgi:sugar O-acyltransferase (sialic acid O-acetyltransferase NeuD family)|nr:acetyltransferase [Bacteroidia bacterium]